MVAKIISADSAFIDSTTLVDDGNHFDGEANDGLFGGFLPPLPVEDEFIISASSLDFTTNDLRRSNDVARFTTVGPVVIDSYKILSGDTLVNPGEIVPLQLTLKNEGKTVTAKNIKAKLSSLDSDQIKFAGGTTFADIAPGGTSIARGANVFTLPEDFPDNNEIAFKVDIFCGDHSYWSDTLYFYIYPTGVVENEEKKAPLGFSLFQNYPNPFNASTVFSYQLPANSFVELIIYSITGQKITTLVSEQQQAGNHRFEWDGGGFASGVYFYQLVANDSKSEGKSFVETKKLILLK
ncbi:T9SS type A sorting domain-containing protein [candidate division KSB1 bacterium]|nr:T9SS type A sorting domain-containing protein [candidate division KSB1 bacterium]